MDYTTIEIKRFGEKFYKFRHRSGLKIIVCPKKDFTSSYALIGTKFGSVNSEFINNGRKIKVPDGTAHYLEHKLFESEEGDAFQLYAKTGASANAYTSFETTCYLFSCTDNFKESLGILFDLIQSPYFTPETIAKEQGIIGQEIKMYQDSPEWKVTMNLLQALYQNHPINKDIAGDVDTIAEITPDVLYDCYNSYYNLNNMVLCVSGNVSVDDVMEVADLKLKDNEPVVTESICPDEPYEVKQTYTEQQLPVAVPLFAIGFKENAPKNFASSKELLCTGIILRAFAGQSSALYRRLIDEKLVNTTFGTEYMEGFGYRCAIFSGESREPEKAAEIIKEEIIKLHETGISQEDFEIAKRWIYGGTAYSLDSNYSIASEVISAEFTGRGIFEDADIMADITLDDVNERLKEQLDPNNCSLSVIKGLD